MDDDNAETTDDTETPETPKPEVALSAKELEFIDEYEYITFNYAPDTYGADVNEKWLTDVNIFLDGGISDTYRTGVEEALEEYNLLLNDELTFRLVNTFEESNIHLIFGELEAIQEIWPDMFDFVGDVNFRGYALFNSDSNFNLTQGRIWVRTKPKFYVFLFKTRIFRL